MKSRNYSFSLSIKYIKMLRSLHILYIVGDIRTGLSLEQQTEIIEETCVSETKKEAQTVLPYLTGGGT